MKLLDSPSNSRSARWGDTELFFPLQKSCGAGKEMASFNGPGWLETMTRAVPLWPCFYLSASQSVLKSIIWLLLPA